MYISFLMLAEKVEALTPSPAPLVFACLYDHSRSLSFSMNHLNQNK
jgi:hypothetical protein